MPVAECRISSFDRKEMLLFGSGESGGVYYVAKDTPMKKLLFGLILGLVCIGSVAAPQQGIPNGQPLPKDPGWAFPVQAGTLPAEPPGNKNIPDSTLSFTQARIDDLLNPPDWFPQSHAPAPQIVKY